ncbi:MAG: hypothetical protein LIP77_11400, partial [Planctomycetes bacterium]|nr:hypothetical protein [Planctomycetota bacterium]
MIAPTRRTVTAAALLALPLLAAGRHPDIVFYVLAGNALLAGLYLSEKRRLDATVLHLSPGPLVRCRADDRVEIAYTVENPGRAPVRAVLRQPVPDGWRGEDLALPVTIPAAGAAVVAFPMQCRRRGDFLFPSPECELAGAGWFTARRQDYAGARALVY